MTSAFASLLAAAIAWILVHIGVAGTRLRDAIVARIGQGAFRGLFVVASLVLLGWLIHAYNAAGPVQQLWIAPRWLVVAAMLLMLPALLLFVCSLSMPNPTSVRGARALEAPDPAGGVLRITRHPMLWAFATWALVHLAVVGTASMAVLAGAIVVTAFAGMPSLDAKYARREPQRWPAFAAATSILPFAAIAAGRNRLALRELGWWRPVLAVLLWAALIAMHPMAFGVDPARYFH
jgi:Predicted membrane protein